MPSLEENIDFWNTKYQWSDHGNEWSQTWGSPSIQWYGSIYIRLIKYLPVDSILEIASGYGRWTSFLKNYCKKLYAVDVSEKCVSFCKEKFKTSKNIFSIQNNGSDLSMIDDTSIDFVFSFDSFVHFDLETINLYMTEIEKKLKFGGIGFIHHSNMAQYPAFINNEAWRSPDMSYEIFGGLCKKRGLNCIVQEEINWGNDKQHLTDCFTLFTKGEFASEVIRFKNYDFTNEAIILKRIHDNYFL